MFTLNRDRDQTKIRFRFRSSAIEPKNYQTKSRTVSAIGLENMAVLLKSNGCDLN